MVNHSALCRSIKYDYINILTMTMLKKIQILNGCETLAFKYILEIRVMLTYTRGDQKVRGKVLLNRIAFIDFYENS